MTTTIDRAEINRRNSLRSTGPRSPEGKQRSKFNAVKHGMSAATPVLPGEDPDAFRDRLDAWAEALDPNNVVEQFLVEQAATTSWKIERAHRVETARLAAILQSVPAGQAQREIDEAEALGRQLLGLDVEPPPRSGPAPGPGGPIATTPAASGPSGSAEGRKGPREIVDRLELSAAGCRWLLDQWAALRAILDRGDSWSNDDLDTAVCLLGLEPVRREEAVWDYLLRREPDPADLEEHRLRLGRQLDETITSEGTRDRAVLGAIVDRAVARLDPLLSAHTQRTAADTAELDQRLAFDADEDGERLRRYHFGCEQSLRRTLETLLKLRRGARGQRRGAGDEAGRSAAAPTERNEATAPSGTGLLPVSAPGDGPEIPVAPASDSESVPEEGFSGGRASGRAGLSGERGSAGASPSHFGNRFSQPPVPNEATAPVVAQPSVQNEAKAPAVDRSRPQNEAIAPAGGTGRPVPIVLVTAVALMALVFSACIAATSERSADVLGPDPSPPGHRATEKARMSATSRARSIAPYRFCGLPSGSHVKNGRTDHPG